jgi:hypothetical protein
MIASLPAKCGAPTTLGQEFAAGNGRFVQNAPVFREIARLKQKQQWLSIKPWRV